MVYAHIHIYALTNTDTNTATQSHNQYAHPAYKTKQYSELDFNSNYFNINVLNLFQVFDDIAVELTMALLQFFSEKPSEEHLFRTLKALSKFVTVKLQLSQFY